MTESDFICPEAESHGNPFRYCGVPGCGWMEPVTAPTPGTPATTVSMGDARRIAVEIADQAEAERVAAVTAEAGTPAATPRPDRFRVLDDNRPRLIGRGDYCTCGGNPGVGGAQHEPHCGWDLIGYVDEILPAFAEILSAREAAVREEGRAERVSEMRELVEEIDRLTPMVDLADELAERLAVAQATIRDLRAEVAAAREEIDRQEWARRMEGLCSDKHAANMSGHLRAMARESVRNRRRARSAEAEVARRAAAAAVPDTTPEGDPS